MNRPSLRKKKSAAATGASQVNAAAPRPRVAKVERSSIVPGAGRQLSIPFAPPPPRKSPPPPPSAPPPRKTAPPPRHSVVAAQKSELQARQSVGIPPRKSASPPSEPKQSPSHSPVRRDGLGLTGLNPLNKVNIPGNAGASVTTAMPLMSMPEVNAKGTALIDSETGKPSILKLQAISPSMLEMENQRQQHQINRMASIRHSMAVHSSNMETRHKSKNQNPRPSVAFADAPMRSAAFASRRRFTILRPEDTDNPERNINLRPPDEEWETVTSVRANDLYNVTKYRSKGTGLEVVHAKLESPTVHGYFVIPTKCENDWGLPHILDHMVFLGSKNYPYPGVLDQLASKCLASGTNAWTDSDHSCYTLTTAGKEGFLSLLPIYMDHIFFPTLGEAGYLTEVHHINEEGRDAGVCYVEMQSIEHDPVEQANWSLLRKIYPRKSGYYYNYGGHCKDMRESCTLQAVRNFHKQFYHSKNACLVVCGDLEKEDILSVINPFMQQLKESKSTPKQWKKPWLSEPPVQIVGNIETIVPFPSEHEGIALVKIGIVGPVVTEDVTKSVAMHLLMEYLLDSPVAPIQLEFVEHENALASSANLTEINHVQMVICLSFENVPVKDMKGIPVLLRKLLEKQIDSQFDTERMEFIVNHCYQQALSAMENAAEETIAHAVISDFLYGSKDDGLMFDRRINNAYTIEQFTNQSADFWKKMIKTLLDCDWATVYMVPSKDVHEEFIQEEEERFAATNEKLGESGRKKLAARLRAATKIQAKAAPPELLNSVTTPSIASIGFLGIERQDNPDWASETLCNVYLDDINSSYVYLTAIMDTSELTLEQKKYLVIFSEAILESPYVDNSETLFTYEQMVAGLNRDVLRYETFFGLDWDPKEGTRFSCGSYSHLFCIRFQLEMKKVKEGFEWMQLLLWNTKWQADRLKIITQRMANDVNHLQDRGSVMSHAILADSLFQMNSNVKAINLVRQQAFLQRIAEELPRSFKRDAKVLEAIRMVILRPENTTVHVATSIPKMEFYLTDKPEIRDAVAQLLKRTFDYTGWNWGYQTKRLANDPDFKHMKSSPCIGKCVPEKILRMHSDEGSYLIQAAPCIRDYNDPDYPLILTTIQYFCQNEGPFYKAIRSTGFASGYIIKVKPNQGMIFFELRPCIDLVAAYCGAFDIIVSHLGEEKDLWNEGLLQSAKSSTIFDLIEQENTPRTLALHSLIDYFHGVPPNFNRQLMERITQVTMAEVKNMTKKYFRGLFIETCTCCAAAPEDKVHGIIKGLMDHCGKRLSLLPPVNQSEMAAFY